jgi:ferredoxin
MSKVKGLKLFIRLLILTTALFFSIGGPLPVWMERMVPALSPLTLFAESIAQRTWYAGLFWTIPPLAVLALAVWKGRFFCQWLCPLGTIYALPNMTGKSRCGGTAASPSTGIEADAPPKKNILPVRLNAAVFWIVISSAVFGLPALLLLDPLSTLSRIGAWSAWVPGLLIPIFLLLSFFQPQVWCTHLCPLGYCFDLANVKNSKRVFNRDRRQFIAGLGIGIPAALLLPKLAKAKAKPSVLPPGATGEFAGTCTRCYACVSACPAGIIRVKRGGGLSELFMPELRFDRGACEESCNQCSQVCPTGAIRRLSDDEKWRRQIGAAKVEKEKCLAWTDNEYCMVCDEYCPYNSIDTEWHGDIACPIVNPAICRGCGACENACPAIRAGKAIFVHPLNPQKTIKGVP